VPCQLLWMRTMIYEERESRNMLHLDSSWISHQLFCPGVVCDQFLCAFFLKFFFLISIPQNWLRLSFWRLDACCCLVFFYVSVGNWVRIEKPRGKKTRCGVVVEGCSGIIARRNIYNYVYNDHCFVCLFLFVFLRIF
jgi:hypothetical protein